MEHETFLFDRFHHVKKVGEVSCHLAGWFSNVFVEMEGFMVCHRPQD
jgi:hypothetical protein